VHCPNPACGLYSAGQREKWQTAWTYNVEIIKNPRDNLNLPVQKIEPKIYEYGFLK
jgi:hypothetical protein